MVDAAKFVTQTGQPAIFLIAVVNKKWFEALPKDLQDILEKDAAAQSLAINPYAVEQVKESESSFTSKGGELITLPPAERSQMLKTIASVGPDVSSKNPALAAAYKIVADAAARTRQASSQ
jgi:TRAP-type C4-dicarboxylate transport system substrate-binding protein